MRRVTLSPATTSRETSTSKRGYSRAATRIGRILLVVALALCFWALRGESSIILRASLAAFCVIGAYFAFGRRSDFRLLATYIILYALFVQLRAVADETGVPVSFNYVAELDATVFGLQAGTWLQREIYEPGRLDPITLVSSIVYASYFFVAHTIVLILWLKRSMAFKPVTGAILLAYYAGLIVSGILPMAPPWLAGQEGLMPSTTRIFEEVLKGEAYVRGSQIAGVNPVAAMPSLHFAITAVIAMVAWRTNRRLGALGWLYAAAMGFALVYLGEHYVIDCVAGGALAAACWYLAVRLWPAVRSFNAREGHLVHLPDAATPNSEPATAQVA